MSKKAKSLNNIQYDIALHIAVKQLKEIQHTCSIRALHSEETGVTVILTCRDIQESLRRSPTCPYHQTHTPLDNNTTQRYNNNTQLL